MMFATRPGELTLIAKNVADGTRPAATVGTSLTPTQNSFPAATEVIASGSVTSDIYAVELTFHAWGISTESRQALIRVYLGGQLWIPDLLVQAGALIGNAHETSFYFPLYGASGQTVSAAASVSSATLTAGYIICKLYGKPSGPVWAGSFVRAYGADTATSRGTAVTPGTTSEGAYAEIGTLADTIRYWEYGLAVDDANLSASGYFVDSAVGDATNKKAIHADDLARSDNTEGIGKRIASRAALGVSGDKCYMRMQNSGTLDTNVSACMYGVG